MRNLLKSRPFLGALCGAIVGVAVLTWAFMPGERGSFRATVTVATTGRTIGEINSSFIGLSFESENLNSGKFDTVGNLVPLLRNIGPSVMRFGGNSVDQSFSGITPRALAGLARLAQATSWRVLYSENLGHFNGAVTGADAHAVQAALGSHLAGFACGNEPDDYHDNGLRPRSYALASYLSEAASCFASVRAGASSASLEGPDAAHVSWLSAYAKAEAGTISMLGQHYYPLGCHLPGQSIGQLADTLLSTALAAKEAATFRHWMAAAKTAHVPLRITETNSACDGGVRGLSDSYATALWAIDYLLTGAENGVAGMNFHSELGTSCQGYTPLCQVGTNEYAAQPIYYGMLLAHLLGTGRILTVKTTMLPPFERLAAFALRPTTGAGYRVMLENLGPDRVTVTLRVGSAPRAGTMLHLTGPSLLATSGVAIQGKTVAPDGRFTPGQPDTLQCTSQGCPVAMDPYTAILVTLS